MYYHLTSNHQLLTPLFRDDEDKEVFINKLALKVLSSNLSVYAYCIMDNHIHILAGGSSEDIRGMFCEVKRDYIRYVTSKWGKEISFKDFNPELKEISDASYFRYAVAYILRNPFAANISSPFAYGWSSWYLYFNPNRAAMAEVPLKEYGRMRLKRVVRTRMDIPLDIKMLGNIISPWIWCDFKSVEDIFGTSADLFKVVSRWNIEKEFDSYVQDREINSYSDGYILGVISDYCRSFGTALPQGLDVVSFRKLISKLSRQYGCTKAQIARLTGADEGTLLRFA